MNRKSLKKKILLQKIMLNFLLKFLYLTNFFIVYIYQNLDKHVLRYQHLIYKSYNKKAKKNILLRNQQLHNIKKHLIIQWGVYFKTISQHAGGLNIHTCSSQVGSAQLASAIFWYKMKPDIHKCVANPVNIM